MHPTLNPADRPLRSGHLHRVHFYQHITFTLGSFSDLIVNGLEKGESAVVVMTQPHCAEIEERLRLRGIDLCQMRDQGLYLDLNAAATLSKLMRKGGPNEKTFTRVIGGAIRKGAVASPRRKVRAFGEMVNLLVEKGRGEAALKLEQLWNSLATKIHFSLHCVYSLEALVEDREGTLFSRICAEHSDVVPAESFTALRKPAEQMRSVADLQHKAIWEAARHSRVQKSLDMREKELTEFIDSAVDSFHEIGPGGRILWANPALLILLGYCAQEYVGHKVGEFYLDSGSFDEFWQKTQRGELVHDYPSRLRCKNGSFKDVVIRSNGYWDGHKFLYARCFVRDVTEQEQLAKQLRNANERIAEAELRKSHLLAMLCNELYVPLVAVAKAVAIARLDAVRQAPALEIAQQQTNRLVGLVGVLLEVARTGQDF